MNNDLHDYRYGELAVGMKEEFFYEVTAERMEMFRVLTGDENPLHCEKHYARDRGFDDRVVYGMLHASLFSTMAGMYLPGKNSLLEHVDVQFAKPVYVGEKLRVCGQIMEKNDKYRRIAVKMAIYNEKDSKVCRGKMEIGVLA